VVVLGLRPRRFDPGLARAALSFGLPLVPHGLSAWILNLSDRWLIGLFIGLPAFAAQAAVGIYAFGYVLGQAIALVAVSFNSAWSPFFYARGTGPRGPELLREMTSLSTAVLSVLAVTVAVLAPELTDVLARERWGDAAAAAADVVPIVALASLVYGIYFMVVSSLFLLHRTRVLPLLSAAAGAVNVAVNIALIPRIGITGAAWATLAGYGALTLGTYLYARRAYPIRLDVPRLATLFGLAIGVALLSRLVRPEDGLLLSGGVHLALAAGFGVAAVLVARGTVARLRAIVPLSTLGIAADRMAIPKEDA
jgi:O-antigen/teichoic acid export membrane protein